MATVAKEGNLPVYLYTGERQDPDIALEQFNALMDIGEPLEGPFKGARLYIDGQWKVSYIPASFTGNGLRPEDKAAWKEYDRTTREAGASVTDPLWGKAVTATLDVFKVGNSYATKVHISGISDNSYKANNSPLMNVAFLMPDDKPHTVTNISTGSRWGAEILTHDWNGGSWRFTINPKDQDRLRKKAAQKASK